AHLENTGDIVAGVQVDIGLSGQLEVVQDVIHGVLVLAALDVVIFDAPVLEAAHDGRDLDELGLGANEKVNHAGSLLAWKCRACCREILCHSKFMMVFRIWPAMPVWLPRSSLRTWTLSPAISSHGTARAWATTGCVGAGIRCAT